MLCKDIIKKINESFPEERAMEWDNVGLLCGRDDKEVRRIYISLDATDYIIEDAIRWKADMLITHHPLIFSGIKKINDRDFVGRRLLKMIQNDMCYYAMHTNYDVCGMAELSGNILGLQNAEVLEVTYNGKCEEGIGRIADVAEEMTLDECCDLVKEKFMVSNIKVFGNLGTKVKRVAISPGSGKSMINIAISKGADVLITGDIDHHTGIDAFAQGLCVIDAGHYGLERIFIPDMKEHLENVLDDVIVKAADVYSPFLVV